jgi:putative Mg2+ transporter-C (MgtC) family protein
MSISLDPFVARLLISAGLSAAIGFEREYHRKPAGLRTNMLIGIGSAMFTILSIRFADGGQGTVDRVAAQIATGIGFLGAGAILRDQHNVHGLTTAATIWVNAAIGMAAGLGSYTIATVGAAITLVVLALLPIMENLVERRRGGPP